MFRTSSPAGWPGKATVASSLKATWAAYFPAPAATSMAMAMTISLGYHLRLNMLDPPKKSDGNSTSADKIRQI
jgi:hypothetical protein